MMGRVSEPAPNKELLSSWWWPLLGLVVAFGLGRCLRVQDPDVWWHVATGKWLLAHGWLPHEDPFSFTAPAGVRYSELLADLWFSGWHAVGGAGGIVASQVVTAAVLAALLLILASRGQRSWSCAMAAAALVTLTWHAVGWRLQPRTDVFTLLGLAVELGWLGACERRARPIHPWLLPVGSAIWVNLHRGVTAGLAVLMLSLVVWLLFKETRRLGRALLPWTGLALLAATVNPGGLRSLLDGYRLMHEPAFYGHLPEWRAADWHFLFVEHPMIGLAFAALPVAWASRVIARWRRASSSRGGTESSTMASRLTAMLQCALEREDLVAAACVALALSSVRFSALGVIGCVPPLARAAAQLLEMAGRPLSAWARPGVWTWLVSAGATASIGSSYFDSNPPALWGLGVADHQLPVAAAQFLANNPPPGAMYNSFRLGGYLLYALAPRQRVFIDGRNDTLYPVSFFDETIRAKEEPSVLDAQLYQYGIGYAVLECRQLQCPYYQRLLASPAWRLVYWDDQVAIVVREGPEAAAYLAQHAFATLRAGDAVARLSKLSAQPDQELLVTDLRRLLREQPKSARAWALWSGVQEQEGNDAGAEESRENVRALLRSRGAGINP